MKGFIESVFKNMRQNVQLFTSKMVILQPENLKKYI